MPRINQSSNPRPPNLRLTSACSDLVEIQTYMPENIRYNGALDSLAKMIGTIELYGQWNEVEELVKKIKDQLIVKMAPPTMAEKLDWLEKQCIIYKCESVTMQFEPQPPRGEYRFVPLPPTVMDASPQGITGEFRIRAPPMRPADMPSSWIEVSSTCQCEWCRYTRELREYERNNVGHR